MKYEYQIEPDGSGVLEVCPGVGWRNTKVLYNGVQVDQISRPKDFKDGREVQLPDGSTVNIRLKSFPWGELFVTRRGRPVGDGSAEANAMLQNAANLVFFVAFGTLALGILSASMDMSDFIGETNLWAAIVIGLVFLLLGVLVKKRSMAALVTALALFGLDTLFLLIALFQGQGAAVGGIVFRGFLLWGMYRGVGAIRTLNQIDRSRLEIPMV